MIDLGVCLFAMGCCESSVQLVRDWSWQQKPKDRRTSKLLAEMGHQKWLDDPAEYEKKATCIQWIWWMATDHIRERHPANSVYDMPKDLSHYQLVQLVAKRILWMSQLDEGAYRGSSEWGLDKRRIRIARELVPQLRKAGLL